jgi:hypothetical protein
MTTTFSPQEESRVQGGNEGKKKKKWSTTTMAKAYDY